MGARVVGLTLVGLGGCALAVAVLLGTPLAGTARAASSGELALDGSSRSVAVAVDEVTYLDPASLTERTSDEVSVSVRVRGDAASGDADDDTAVRVSESTTADGDGTLVATTTTVACLDRRTAAAQDCAAESVDGRPVDVRGLTTAFPPGAGPRDHDVWDGATGRALPARFTGTEEFRGLSVHRFEQEVPEQVVGTVTVPGELVGGAGGTVDADVVHSNTRTMLVEPVSGIVVRTEESPLTVLRGDDGTAGAVLLDGTMTTSERSAGDAVARAQDVLDRRELTGTVLPRGLGGAGVLLTALGVLLVTRARPSADQQPEDEPARVPVATA